MADGQKRSLTDAESAEEERPSTKRRKPRNGVTQLAEIRPGTVYQLVAQYGSADDPIFIMQLVLDGKIFKGLGPSKTKAKAMAAEFALLHLGIIASLTESPPDLSSQPYCWDDFTADIFDSNCHIYFDFDHQATSADGDHDAEAGAGRTGEENAEESEGISESRMIGKNALTILMDRHPGSSYKLVVAQVNSVRTKFVMDCYVNGQVFRGVGMSKRLAKARAAKQALQKLDNMEFGTGEDGMPFYEGDEKLWLQYKAELEKEAELKLQHEVGDNPAQQLSEYFPDAKFNFPDTFEKPDIADFFVCSISVEGTTYEGSGTSKRDAKNDAAASVLNDLERKGILKQKELEMENKKQEREERKKAKDGTERKATAYKSAVAKLNDNFQNIEYKFLSEGPVKDMRITAFTVAVGIKGRHYVGVGKNKRMAKLDAAEKVLRDLGMWTEQDEQAKERVKTEEDDLDIVGEQPRRLEFWAGPTVLGIRVGGQAVNWNSGANQYMGYDNNGSWGYNGGYYGREGVWGQMGVNHGGHFETIQPMMKEIMGSMFENAFGNNPWKADSGIGVDLAPYGGTDCNGSKWNTNSGTHLGNKADGNSCGSTADLAMHTSAENSSLLLNSQSGMKSSRLTTDHSKETPEDKSGKLSKYPNFRSAGCDTGFTPSYTDQAVASSLAQKQFSQQPQPPSNYGPYGTPINPSVAGNQNASFQNFRSLKDGVVSGALTTNTANSQGGLFAKDQRRAPFQNTGIYTAGASANLQNSSTSSGVYSYGSTESLLHRGHGNSTGTCGTGMYSDFGNSSYQGYAMTSRADGFQPAGNSANSFTLGGGNTPSGYNSSSYSSGGSNFQSSGTNYNYSGTGGNAVAQATSVPATVYQSNQVNYSTNFQADTGNSATVTSFSSGSFQENAGGSNYMTDGSSGFYGMYGSGFQHQSQGYNFGYNSSGGYNINTGYELDSCQNTNSGYSYEYSAPSAGTDSYYTNMNRTTW